MSALKDKQNVALHEAAHWLIARNYGLRAKASIWRNASGDGNEKAWLGAVQRQSTTSFRTAVIGWAGMIAEREIHHFDDASISKLKERFEEFLEFEQEFGCLSSADMENVSSYPHQWRTFRTAWKLLQSKRAELEAAASNLFQRGEL